MRKDDVVAEENPLVELGMAELREVTAYAVACAEPVLAIFERDCPDDPRPRAVLDEARTAMAGTAARSSGRVTVLVWAVSLDLG